VALQLATALLAAVVVVTQDLLTTKAVLLDLAALQVQTSLELLR
jgi:hypothetical protein